MYTGHVGAIFEVEDIPLPPAWGDVLLASQARAGDQAAPRTSSPGLVEKAHDCR